MLFKTTLIKPFNISFNENTIIAFNNNIQFTLVPQLKNNDHGGTYLFHIENVKGDFEIVEIVHPQSHYNSDIKFDKVLKTFITNNQNKSLNFHVLTDVEFKKVAYVNVTYQVYVALEKMKLLKIYEYYEKQITLPDHPYLFFKCYIKCVREDTVEILIKNPYNVEIQGKTGDFSQEFKTYTLGDYKQTLSFVFDPTNLEESLDILEDEDESTTKNQKSINFDFPIYDIISKNIYTDVILISSDEVEIPTYRFILANYSEIFKQILEEKKETPVKTHIESFDAKIIKAAVDFCYGKIDAIIGNEAKLFEFATKYGINELKKVCCSFMEASVNHSNVCEYIKIAYSNKFENLKQKCCDIMKKNKSKIDSSKLNDLPKEILVDVFYA